jgi:hypothetical protein
MEEESRQSDLRDLRYWSNQLTAFLSAGRNETRDIVDPEESIEVVDNDTIVMQEEVVVGDQLRLVVAIEFGLEFTGTYTIEAGLEMLTFLAIAFATPRGDTICFEEIDLLEDWGRGNSSKLPTSISYSREGERYLWCNGQLGDLVYDGTDVASPRSAHTR